MRKDKQVARNIDISVFGEPEKKPSQRKKFQYPPLVFGHWKNRKTCRNNYLLQELYIHPKFVVRIKIKLPLMLCHIKLWCSTFTSGQKLYNIRSCQSILHFILNKFSVNRNNLLLKQRFYTKIDNITKWCQLSKQHKLCPLKINKSVHFIVELRILT